MSISTLFSTTVERIDSTKTQSVIATGPWSQQYRCSLSAKFLLASILLSATFLQPSPIRAQGLRITQPGPNCQLFRPASDNPFDDTHHYIQPRIAWHVEYALGSLALGYGLHKLAPRVPPWAIATAVTLGVGLVPHIRGGLLKRQYPIDPLDWAFDLWDRATPAFWAVAHRHDSTAIVWRNHAASTGTWVVGYAALACWASP